ncbi:MAG TPA: helix-turn-helix transcriptional regulator [Hyphomicrobiaceae bacterium]|nr:helix-turn-helix transcriptional regulator [Hyphomicrobiaceae bacterium]
MPHNHSAPRDRDAAIADIRKAMIEKKLTQAELADAADCHEKTVQNLLGGRSVRDQTLFDVCMVLGLDYERVKADWDGSPMNGANEPMDLKGEGGLVAPIYMGAYTRAAVDHYIGSYLTLRPAFSLPSVIIAYRTDIIWDPEWPSLLFEESGRPDATYSHRGRLYMPASSSFIHLVSLTKGAMRMVLVSQVDRLGAMRGLITTLNKQGAMLMPVSSPIVYQRQDEFQSGSLGQIPPEHHDHPRYRALLEETIADGYAKVVER